MARLHELFHYLRDHDGSDLHLAAGLEPRIRRRGELEAVEGWPSLSDEDLRALLQEIANEAQWRDYENSGDLDFAYALPGVARFRANYLRQQNGASAVFRIIPERIVALADLGLPPAIGRLCHLRHGLVLVTGPTGSGKSTTLAAMIDVINSTYAKHIVTIEDPVEFVHQNKLSTFSQREVGSDTESFAAALRSAIRQDADVILVGEMRDLVTISLAITAAEMGTLVFGTLHTNGAANTIGRLIDAFPADEQAQARTTLAESLAGVVSQLLLRTADGQGRLAVNEILLKTSGLPNIIREGNTPLLQTVMQGGKGIGMQLMDDALAALVDARKVTALDAMLKATDKIRFEAAAKEEAAAGGH
jgi:twitching motility protein PilT